MVRVTDPTIFGRIWSAHEIEVAGLQTLQTWMYTYLREMERQLGLPYHTIPDPIRYTNRNIFDAVPGEPLARIVVIAGGLINVPYINGWGQHMATWRLGVGCAANHESDLQARFITSAYAAAVRGIIIQKPSLGGIANMAEWIAETPVNLPINDQLLQYSAVRLYFNIQIADVVTRGKGPDVPDTPPDHYFGPYPTVEEVFIDVERIPFLDE